MVKQKRAIGPTKQKREYYYSIIIIVLIPILIVINTLILTTTVKGDFDRELRRKADTTNNIIGTFIREKINDPQKAQRALEKVLIDDPEIEQLTIVVPEENQSSGLQRYVVLASSEAETVGEEAEGLLLTTAVQQARSVATEQTLADGTRTWAVATLIEEDGGGGDIEGIVVANYGFTRINMLVGELLSQSFFILMVVVAVVFLLLLNHFKFVNYSVLFKKLKEVDQLKNDFLSVATHELKSPMGTIKGALENIKDGIFGPVNEKTLESVELALSETDRLANLVTDLLNVSRIEQGRITYNTEPVNLQEILLHITNQYRSRAQEKGLSLVYEPTEMNYIITADHGRILEIFTNLIDNAIKYSLKGEVTVTHSIEKDIVKTIVKDTGIGLSAKEREKLFSRFYRVQNEKTSAISGTGLGLWIIKQYIEAMKGKIYVDSLEGVGSSFTVEFPLTATKPAPGLEPHPSDEPK